MMNHSTGVMRRSRRAWPAMPRTAAAIIATAGLALLAACSGSPSTGSGGSPNAGGPANPPSANSQKALAFSRCVRSHGVPNFPDPTSSGGVPKETAQQLGVSNSQLQAALKACQHLLPNTGNVDDNPAALNQWWSLMLHFAQCMHSRGVPNWPDPSPYPRIPCGQLSTCRPPALAFTWGPSPETS